MTINCQVCGTANPDSNKYCDGCGVELTNNAPATESAPASDAAATAAETTVTPSASMSQVTPPDSAVSVPAPGADLTAGSSAAIPVTPLTPPEPLTNATIGSGTTPNPYQTPLSETMIGQMDSSAPASTPAAPESTSSTPVETPAPVETVTAEAAPAPVEAAPAETPASAAPVSVSTPGAPATGSGGAAKLGLKKFGQPTGDFIPLQGEKLVVGRFDASSGPVDIDLGEMAGKEHISRHHAELYVENGTWHVRDLGSTNGVFLKKKGESTFSPRLQEPAALADGDELAFGNVMLTFNQG